MANSNQIKPAVFDKDYVAALIDGDPTVAEHFATYFSKKLDLKLRHRLRCPALIQDIRQETLSRVLITLRDKNTLRKPGCLGAFVNGVCNHVLSEHWRSAARTDNRQQCSDIADGDLNPEEIFQNVENTLHLRTAMRQLGRKDFNLLKWLYLEEQDRSQIIRRLGVNPEYLRVLLHRALLHLRNSFIKILPPKVSARPV